MLYGQWNFVQVILHSPILILTNAFFRVSGMSLSRFVYLKLWGSCNNWCIRLEHYQLLCPVGECQSHSMTRRWVPQTSIAFDSFLAIPPGGTLQYYQHPSKRRATSMTWACSILLDYPTSICGKSGVLKNFVSGAAGESRGFLQAFDSIQAIIDILPVFQHRRWHII